MSIKETSLNDKLTYVNISERMRQRRKNIGLTQAAIAKQVGVSRVSVTQWESGATNPKGENLYTLCRVLQCQPEWLLYGKDDLRKVGEYSAVYKVIQGPDTIRRIPLISWIQAGEWTAIFHKIEQGAAEEWQETTAKVGPNAFALRVRGDSMLNPLGFPSIPEGSIVIVDPDGHAKHGKIVVAKLEDSAEVTLKKLILDGPDRYLKPLNPDYRLIKIKGNYTIVGVVRQVISDL